MSNALDFQYLLEGNKRQIKSPALMSIIFDFIPVFGTMKATLKSIYGTYMTTGKGISI